MGDHEAQFRRPRFARVANRTVGGLRSQSSSNRIRRKIPVQKRVARTTALRPIAFGGRAAFVVRVFSAPSWSDQIRARGSEGILTRSRVGPTSPFMSAALKKPGQAADRTG